MDKDYLIVGAVIAAAFFLNKSAQIKQALTLTEETAVQPGEEVASTPATVAAPKEQLLMIEAQAVDLDILDNPVMSNNPGPENYLYQEQCEWETPFAGLG